MSTGVDPWALPQVPFRFSFAVSRFGLEGPDSLRVLHGQTTQAIEGLQPGQSSETCCVTATARLIALARVTVEQDGASLLLTAGPGEQVRQAIDRVLFPADRVRLGPLEALEWHGLVETGGAQGSEVAGGAGWGLPGRHWLLPVGAPLPPELAAVQPLAPQLQEWLRIRQGLPAAPGEINDDFNPFELGLAERVSLNKGCYLGQETLAKLNSRDGIKQQLRRWWAADSGSLPAAGQPLLGADQQRLGRITSVLPGTADLPCCGLAMVRRAWLEAPELAGLQLSLPAALSFNSQAATAQVARQSSRL